MGTHSHVPVTAAGGGLVESRWSWVVLGGGTGEQVPEGTSVVLC